MPISTKFDKVAFARTGGLGAVDMIVTDSGLGRKRYAELAEQVKVVDV